MNSMKLMVLEMLQDIPEGIELAYEAVENTVTISINYSEREKFDMLDEHVNNLIKRFEDKGYKATYDNINNRKFNEILQHSRYVCMRIIKEDK